ncbi:MAG: class I SAM-dependent methyltransferase [Aquabacterium sp.]
MTTPPDTERPAAAAGAAAQAEAQAMAQRYARRDQGRPPAGLPRYSPLRPEVWQTVQERQRTMLRLFDQLGWRDLSARRGLELGCGAGDNLLELLRLGFAPEHLAGIELLPDRAAQARRRLPAALPVQAGDALVATVAPGSLDLVLQSTVFTSVLDDAVQHDLAAAMWRWLKPGGGVLWYDFTVDNPRNPDVRGVPLRRVRALFPHGSLWHRRVTLAPPLARAVCAWHPGLYPLFNALPFLRTHILAWIAKPA